MAPPPSSDRASLNPEEGRSSVIPLADVERRVLFLDALRAFKGSVSRAAKALEVSKVFYAKLKRRGVDPKRHSDPGRDVH